MNKRNYELTLNVTTGKIKIPSINIYNTDKGIFNIKLFLEKGEGKNIAKLTHDEMLNYKALFQAVKSKTKNYVELEGVLDETENFFYYDLGSKFNDQVGVYNCQIFITDTKGTNDNTTDDEVVTSVPFNYNVTASILTGLNAEITANPDLPVLKELINECKILMKLDNADMSVLDPFQKKEDNAIDGADKNIISNINSINSQIKDKANKDDVFSMANMGQDIKEAMTGGSVAVVGRNSVVKENIVSKQVTPEKTNFIDVVTDNLIYGVNYDVGKAVNPSDGTLYDVSSYQTTDFVNCLEGQLLVFTGTTNLCFYDENKTFVEGKQGGQWTSPIIVPTNAKYFRWSYPIKDEKTSHVTLKGNTNIVPQFYLNDSLFSTTKEKLESILNLKPLKNKKINILGDSNSSLDYLTPNWIQNIENKTGATANNYGVSGTTIAFNENRENNAGKCFANRVNELQECDVTIIMGGTNDVNSQIPLGNWEDTTNETLYGAINIIITTLLNKFPGKPIVWCTPIQDRNSYKNKPVANLETTVLGASAMANINYTLLNGAIKLKCRQYGIHFINLYEESGINGADTNFVYYRNSTDTVHMSLLGHGRVSNIIQSKLEEII